MRRRILLSSMAGAFLSPCMVRAQQKKMPVIGFLSGASPGSTGSFVAAFRQGLNETGYTEGQNVAFENRWAEDNYERLPQLAADLVDRKVNVIAAISDPAAHAAKRATSTIPVVFSAGDDPVAYGLVASLARPGGNLTGVSPLSAELNPKRFELLRELVPAAGVIGVLVNPNNLIAERVIRELQEAARPSGVQVAILKAGNQSEIDDVFASLAQRKVGALFVTTDVFITSRRGQIVALASRHAVPSMYAFRTFAVSGGLISYGASLTEVYRQVGNYVGRILNGAKPADLPVQQPTTFELTINMKTAKALGLTIPTALLASADEVIE